MLASLKGINWTELDPQLCLALARAAHNTFMAEEETEELKITKCENLLKNTLDDARARVKDAHKKIASVLLFFNQQQI
jgi:hypothetical protein